MARHTITEAARLSGKSPRTLYTHIKNGKLSTQRSASDTLVVDTAELVRVYGDLHDAASGSSSDKQAPAREMQSEIERLRAQLRERDEINQLLRQQNSQLVKLLEDQSPGKQRSPLGTLTEALADRIRGGTK